MTHRLWLTASVAWLACGPQVAAAQDTLARLAPSPGLLALIGLALAGLGLALHRRR